MNEATADNNGVYLLDGRHGNGCRQSEGEREREREREIEGEGERERGSIALRSVDPYTGAPLSFSTCYLSPSPCIERQIVFTQNYLHMIALNVLDSVSSSNKARCPAPTYIYTKTDAAK